jgi:hypothetical protein
MTLAQLASQPIWNRPLEQVETLCSGIPQFDTITGGCPRGRITEITGAASSGRTSLLHRILAAAAERGETLAVVDATNAFDPVTAAAGGVDLDALVWVRCAGNMEHAFKAADLLLSAGGFGIVALDLCDVPRRHTQRIPISYWFRFQRAVEKSQTVFLVLNQEPMARSTASLVAAVKREEAQFTGGAPFELLRGARFHVQARRPLRAETAEFAAVAV